MGKNKLSHSLYRNLLFVVGMVATLAYRVIVVLNHYSQVWVEIAWYVGTLGFIWYFAHRYRVENKRDNLVEDQRLAYKVERGIKLGQKDREALVYILKGLKSSKAKWNYIVIFLFSIIALIYGTYVNIMKWLG